VVFVKKQRIVHTGSQVRSSKLCKRHADNDLGYTGVVSELFFACLITVALSQCPSTIPFAWFDGYCLC
jgi:hypothetical protein